jgi:hypothetical protein
MLSVKLNGSFVEIGNDFSMTMNLKSPIFNETGSSSYPFKIPITPKNAMIMNFWHRIESTVDVYKEIPCEIFWKEALIFIGIFKCRVSTDNYEGSLYEGNGYFNYFRKNISLQQIDFGSILFDNDQEVIDFMNSCKDNPYPDRVVTFPFIAAELYYDPPMTQQELMYFNWYDSKGEMGFYVPGPGDRSLLVPMLYFKFIYFKIFEYLKYDLDDHFFTLNEDFDKCVIFNNVNVNEAVTQAPPDNYFQYLMGETFHDLGPCNILYNYHVPRMSLNDFFTGLENFFNIRLFVNNITKSIRVLSVDDIINSPLCVDFNKNVISITTELDEEIKGFHLKTIPDGNDSILQIEVDKEQITIESIQQPVLTFADLPIWPGCLEEEIRYVILEQKYYSINKYTKIWQKIPSETTIPLFTQFVIKQIDKVISSSFSVSKGDEQEGYVSIGVKRENWSAIPFHLLFTKRIDTENPVVNMVAAVNKSDSISFTVNGTNGLYNKFYKNYFNLLLTSRAVNISKLFTHHELAEIDFARKYQINGINYLLSAIQVTLKKTSISTAKIKAYTCK